MNSTLPVPPPSKRRPRALACIASLAALAILSGCSGVWPASSRSQSAAPPGLAKWGDPVTRAAEVEPGYLIGPEDALEIAVWRDDTLKATALVRPDGGVSFPLAGDLIVAGMTASQVRDELVKRLEKFVPEPVVTVSVVRVASYRIYVLGRVNKPGDFQVGRNLNVLQALTLAGGMTPFASEDEIRIIRNIGGGTVSIPFQYSRIRKGVDLSQNITLRSGDVLLVP